MNSEFDQYKGCTVALINDFDGSAVYMTLEKLSRIIIEEVKKNNKRNKITDFTNN